MPNSRTIGYIVLVLGFLGYLMVQFKPTDYTNAATTDEKIIAVGNTGYEHAYIIMTLIGIILIYINSKFE